MNGHEKLGNNLDAIDRLSEAQAKHLLKMLMASVSGAFYVVEQQLGRPGAIAQTASEAATDLEAAAEITELIVGRTPIAQPTSAAEAELSGVLQEGRAIG